MAGKPVLKRDERERKMNFWEKLYLPEIFKGLKYTGSKISGGENVAFQYPEEQFYPPDAFRGRPVLVEEGGQPRCVACGLCARSCPPLAISMQAGEVMDIKERGPEWFEINMLRCIYCGYCEEVCPEEAVVMSKEYDIVFQDRDEAIFGLDRLLMPKERLQDRLDYLDQYKNPQFGEQWDYKEINNIHTQRERTFLQTLVATQAGDATMEGNQVVVRTDDDAPIGQGVPNNI